MLFELDDVKITTSSSELPLYELVHSYIREQHEIVSLSECSYIDSNY